VFVKPQQGLADRADPLKLVKDQADRFLDPPIRVLLQALILGLAKAHRRYYEQLAALGLGTASLQRALTQEIELILVQAPLESEQ